MHISPSHESSVKGLNMCVNTSPGQYFNISSQYQYYSKTDNTINTILNIQYIDYQHIPRATTTMVKLK